MKRLLSKLVFVALFISCSNQVLYAQGELWGVTQQGGSDGVGVIFKTNLDGTGYTVHKSFKSEFPGLYPPEGLALTQAPNGKLYGTTNRGGTYDYGTIFEYDPTNGTYLTRVNFDYSNTGAEPVGSLLLASNGKMYGMVYSYPPNNWGSIYEFDYNTGSIVTKIKFINFNVGTTPTGTLYQAQNGKFYGVTRTGGSGGYGCLFEWDLSAGTCNSLISFNQTNGSTPSQAPVQASNGKLYGMTVNGGANNLGIIYEYDLTNATFNKHDLTSVEGANPKYGQLSIAPNGKLYGMTSQGGSSNKGVVFEYDPATSTYTKKVDFTGTNGDGPQASFALASNGKLYGITRSGGSALWYGVIFEFDPSTGIYSKRYDLTANDSNGSSGSLMQASNGKLYGQTGASFFDFDLSINAFHKIGTFSSSMNGAHPLGSLVKYTNGKLYGLAAGGVNGYGVLYEYDPATTTFTKKHDFNSVDGIANGSESLLLASNGKLYGTTNNTNGNNGVLFEYDPLTDSYVQKYVFDLIIGGDPRGELTEVNGVLYGLASEGGTGGQYTGGTLFSYNISTGAFTKLHDFSTNEGVSPTGKLLYGSNGKLYGTCSHGGANNDAGTFFEFDPSTSVFTKRHDFINGLDGSPNGWQIQASNGKIYGTTYNGTVFEFDPVTLAWATKISQNAQIGGGLFQSPTGNIYLMTNAALISFDPNSSGYNQIFNLAQGGSFGAYGSYPIGSLIYRAGNQTISFGPLPAKSYGDLPFNLTATASSGLPVSYSSSNPSVATVNGSTVTITSTGTTIITATQPGDINYYPATSVQQTLTVNKANQIITFNALPAKNYGDPAFNLTATGGASGNPVTYVSSNTAVATVAGSTVTIVGVGTTTITASQAGNSNYNAATDVPQAFTVNKANQTIIFNPLPAKNYGDAAFNLTATGGASGNPVTYVSSNTAVATVAGNTVTIVGAGTTTITSSQAGNSNYNAATDVPQPLTVNKANQSVTFNALAAKVYGDAPFTLSATASSTLPVTYSSSNTAVATVSGNTVTIVGAGTTTITASQVGNSNYNAATNVPQTLTVNKANQTITFNALAAKVYGDAPFTLSATASSTLPVTYSSSNTAVATVSGNTVTIVGAGTTTITASQAGNSNYNAATDVLQSLTVNKASQTITFNPLTAKNYGDASFNLTATGGGSGNPVTYSSSNTTVATVSGNTVTIVGAGSTTITASQAGNSNYNAATDVPQTLTVNKANQTITFNALAAKVYGDAPFTLSATASSTLPVTYSSSNTAVATVSGNTVTIVGGGTTTITASQVGNSNYNAATNVPQTLTVNKANQTITFNALAAKVYGDAPFTLSATASSTLPVTYSSSNTAVATVSGNTVTIVGGGTTTITASQVGNSNYNAATNVPQTLTVNKANQTITFNALAAKVYGDAPFTLSATASSTLPVTYSSSNTAVATVNGNTVTIVGGGTTTITASQAGNSNYNAATDVPQTLTVNKASQTITFNALPAKVYGDVPFALSATASSTLLVTYSSSNTAVATVSGNTVTIVGAGTTTITASQAGNSNYNAATDVPQILTVNKSSQTITFSPLAAVNYGDPSFNLTATGGASGNPVTYSSSNTAVATVSGNTVTIVGGGTTTITASQAGNSNYSAATDVPQNLVVNRVTLTATADPQTRIYGDANPALTISYSGFIGTDNASVIDSPPLAATQAGPTSPVGAYAITLSGGSDNSYNFTLVNNTLTINQAPLTATADDKSKIYLDANPALTITYAGFKGLDNASVLDSAPTISTLANTTSPAGTYQITLTGGSDHDYFITDVNGTLTVNKAGQTITFNPLPPKTYGDSQFLLSATGGATGNPVTFISSNTSVATVFGNVVTIVGGGVTTITASQAGNANYNAATDVPQILTVNKATQSITFNPITAQNYGAAPFSLTATSSSGLPVTYVSSNTAVATISGNTATIVGVGTTTITASQAGNTNFSAATDVPQDLTVNRATQTITFNPIASKKFGDLSFTLGATASSTLGVSYVSSNLTVATISGNTVSIIGVGTTTITASQAGNANYFAATDVLQNFTVTASPVAVTPPSVAVCYGTTTTLTASGAQSYTWSPASGLSATIGTSVSASPRASTTYTVTGTYPNGQTASTTVLVKVNAIPLAAGASHSIVMYCGACGGGVTANGLNSSGQLGDGTTTQRISPVALSLSNAAAVSAGASHTLYLKNDGTVWASGLNTNGQLGDGTTSNKPSPVQVVGLSGIVAISAGNSHSLFLKGDGTVWASGLNSSGQLGDGTTVQKSTPFQIAGLSGIIKISGGGSHSLFLKNDGTVYACGNNGNGQLGDGSKVTRKTPVVLATLSGITDLSGGGTHSHFLKNDGTVWGTGLNTNGQLGDGTTTQRLTPVLISSLTNVIMVSGGTSHTLFLKSNGTAYATGLNTDGQLGDGTTTQRTTPVAVNSLAGVVTALDAGAFHSLFLKNDGFAWASGRNTNGQIGDGTTTGKPTPVQVENVNPCGRVAANNPDVAETESEPKINSLNAYPNPADDAVTIEWPAELKQSGAIVLFDGMGKPVIEDNFSVGETTRKLDTSKLAAGIYFLNLKTGEGQLSRKVLVVH